MPYRSDKAVSYKYNATMIEDGKKVIILAFPYVMNIVDVSGVTLSGRVFATAPSKRTQDVMIERSNSEKSLVIQAGQSIIMKQNVDQDEVLKLTRKVISTWWTSCYILRPRYLCYPY